MGLFASRPEEKSEWAGLPAEPLREQSDAELLPPPAADPFAIRPDAAAGSIVITVPSPASDAADPANSAETPT